MHGQTPDRRTEPTGDLTSILFPSHPEHTGPPPFHVFVLFARHLSGRRILTLEWNPGYTGFRFGVLSAPGLIRTGKEDDVVEARKTLEIKHIEDSGLGSDSKRCLEDEDDPIPPTRSRPGT